jgi:hypothetical protein
MLRPRGDPSLAATVTTLEADRDEHDQTRPDESGCWPLGRVQMMFISAYPAWALTLFTLDILVIYGLVAHGDRIGSK